MRVPRWSSLGTPLGNSYLGFFCFLWDFLGTCYWLLPLPPCAVGLPVGELLSELLLASMGPSGNMLLVITTPTMCHPRSLPSLGPFWELSGAFQERSRALQKLSRAIQGLSGALHGFSGAFRSPPEPSRSSPELSSGCLELPKALWSPPGALRSLPRAL